MSASTDLTTLEKVKNYLGLNDNSHNELINALISSASKAIENYCRREFALQERTEYYNGEGCNCLVLGCRPVQSVISVRIISKEENLSSESCVFFYPESGVIEGRHAFPEGLGNLRVTYTAGFETIPPAVDQAATILVVCFYNRKIDSACVVNYPSSDWPSAVKLLLFEYKEDEI